MDKCSLNKTQASLRSNNITNQYNELIDSSGKTISKFNSYLSYIKNLAVQKYGQIPQGLTNPFYLEGKKVKFNKAFFDWVDRNNTIGVKENEVLNEQNRSKFLQGLEKDMLIEQFFDEDLEKSSTEILNKIISKDSNYLEGLAQKLKQYQNNVVPIKLMKQSEIEQYLKNTNQVNNIGIENSSGFFAPLTNEIIINLDKVSSKLPETLLHEIIHANTYSYLRNNEGFAKEWNRLYKQILPFFSEEERNSVYSLSNSDELLTGVFTNTSFMKLLQSKPSINKEYTNLFEDIYNSLKNLIAKVFNLNTEEKTLFDDVFSAATNVIVNSGQIENSELLTKEVLPSFDESDEKRIISVNNEVDKLVAEIETAENDVIVKNVDEYYDIISKHLRNLIERKNYERLKKIFTTEEGVNRFSTLQDILKEANKSLEDIEGIKRKTRSLALSIVQIDKLTDLMIQDVRELLKSKDNSVENIKILQSYLNMSNDWNILLDTANDSFALGNTNTTKKIGEVKQKLSQLDNLIARNDESGVVKTLQNILIPSSQDFIKALNSQLSQEKERLKRQETRKASENDLKKTRDNIESIEKKIKEIDFENSQNVIDFLKGKRGDATFFNSWLETFRDSTDPTIAAFQTFVREQIDAVGTKTREIELAYERELAPLVTDEERRNPALLSKKITFEDKVADRDSKVENVITLANPWQNYRADYQLLINAQEETKLKYQETKLDEDRETYLNAKKARNQFEIDTLYTEYMPEVYEKNKLWEDEIGQELKQQSDEIFSQIAQIDEASRLFGEELYENQINEKEALLLEYKMLGNLNNPDGTPKKGRELEKAKRMQEIRAFNRKYYEWKDNNTAFEKAKQRHSEYIISQGSVENSPEYNQEILNWENNNTRIVIKDEFYKTRDIIVKEINFITKKIKDLKSEENIKQLWDEIQSLTYGLRDEDNQPIGILVQQRGAERIKLAQEYLEELQQNIQNSSGLTKEQQTRISELYSKAKERTISFDERNELDDLIEKQKLNGLSKSDKKRLGELFEELKNLQSNVPTEYYEQVFNNLSTKYGVVLLEGGDIIEEFAEGTRLIPVLESKSLNNLLKNEDFKEWFNLNHYEVERFNSDNNTYEKQWKRTYQWSRIIPNDEQYIEIKPAQKYSYREIKPQYKTERIIGKTIDNKGNWLPNPDKESSNKYRNEKYYRLINATDEESKRLTKILKVHTKYLLSAQEDLTRQNKLYLDVPKVSKERYERNLDFLDKARKNPGDIPKLLWQRIQDRYRDLTNFDEQDTRYEPVFEGKYEKDAITIPIKYIGSMDANSVSLDLFRNISKYTYSSELNKQLLESLPIARAVNRVVEGVDKNKIPSKKNSNRTNAIRRILLKEYDGQKQNLDLAKLGKLEKPVLAVINTSKYLASWSTVKINLPSAIANLVNAFTQNIINAGNSLYSRKSYAYSESIYALRFFPNWQKDYFENKLGGRSLESQLVDVWEPVQGITTESLIGEKSSQSKIYDTLALNPLFNFRDWSEFYVQSRNWMATLYETKVEQNTKDGIKVISLIDAYEKDSKGFIKLKEGIDDEWKVDGKKFNRLKYKIQALNRRIHGNYSTADRTQIEMFALGSIAMFLKKFFYPMFINRFGAGGSLSEYLKLRGTDRYNINFGNERGFYYQSIQIAHKQFKNGLKDWDLISEREKQALAKTAMEIGAMVGAYILMSLMGYSGDDRNKKEKLKEYSWFELNVLYQLDRLYLETSGFIRPGNYGGYLADFQLFTALGKWYKLLLDIIFQDEYQKGLKDADGSYIYQAGDKKWKMQAKRATGIQQMLMLKENPDILLSNYDKNIRGR